MKNIGLFIFALILMWSTNAYSQNLIWTGRCHPDQRETYGVAFSADGSKILSGSECDDAHIRLWEATNGNLLWDYTVASPLMCQVNVKLSSNGNYFGSMEETGYLMIFDNTGANPVLDTVINIGSGGAYSLDFSPDNQNIVVDGADDSLRVYSIATGAKLRAMGSHVGGVYAVDYANYGGFIASGGADNKVKIWNANTGALQATLNGHLTDVMSVKYTPNDDYIVSADVTGKIKLWMQMSGMWMAHTTINAGERVNQVDVSSDGNYIIAACNSNTRLYDFTTGALLATFNVPSGGVVYSAAFQPNTHNVVIGTRSGDVAYWGLDAVIASNNAVSKTDLKFGLLPNPATESISIDTDTSEETFNYSIYTQLGQLVINGTIANHSKIDLTGLASGVYLLKVESDSAFGVNSFVKQ